MEILDRKDNALLEIAYYRKEILREMVSYSLFLKRSDGAWCYGVRISRGAENESCYLGGDLFGCVRFYESLIQGEVFPYSLHELAEDFLSAQKI